MHRQFSPSLRRLFGSVALGALAFFTICGSSCNSGRGGSPSGPIEPGKLTVSPEVYSQMVSAFTVGTLAYETGEKVAEFNKRAEESLRKATQLVPNEPAAWVNLAFLYANRLGKPQESQEALEQARRLMPNSSEIEGVIGFLAARRGQPGMPHFRRAIELNPNNARAHFALAQELMRAGDPPSLAEAQRNLEKIVALQPENLVALLTLAECAIRSDNAQPLTGILPRLKEFSVVWDAQTRSYLAQLEQAASGNLRDGLRPVQVMLRLLLPTLAFQRGKEALDLGRPLETFLGLPSPPSTPAPPDEALTFTQEPLPVFGAEKWTLARSFSPEPELPADLANKFHAEYRVTAKPEGPAAMLFANGKVVRIARADGKTIEVGFPGGPQAKEPSADGILLADINYDFLPDLVLAGAGGLRLYQQTAPDKFTDVTAKTGLPAALTNAPCYGVYAFDIDTEGDLDLIVAPMQGAPIVLRNNGDGTWKPLPLYREVTSVRACVWGDVSGDGVADIAFADAQGKFYAYHNERGGAYRAWEPPALLGAVRALAVADVTRTGVMDVVALMSDGAIARVARKTEGEGWDITEIARWAEAPADGSARLTFAEIDNNGGLDLIATGSAGSRIWLSDAQGAFKPLAAPLAAKMLFVPFLSEGGRLNPLGFSAAGQPVRLVNKGTKNYKWVDLRPRADFVVRPIGGASAKGSDRINSFGIGGEIEMRAGLLYQKQPITAPTVHFGLGEYGQADAARILWPNGYPRTEFALQADQMIVAPYRLGGSCPWLYAWDGERMQLVTDCIWRSPLGMKVNAQGGSAPVSQTRDRIRIRGDQLQPRNGMYDLSICAELWETHFFDDLALLEVDHPVGTEIYIDERFAIPQPSMEIIVTKPAQPVRRAVDDNGTDVTDIVRQRDARYLDTFGRGQYQGVTRDHFVEVELPEAAPRSGPIYLIGNAWLHPTDSAINVALSQGNHPPPNGLRLEVPNGRGGWKTAKPGLGFPTGKIKTVVLDITHIFAPNTPRKIRLRTNLEIYWDFLGWAQGSPETPIQVRRRALHEATLQYRGFSATHQADFSSPELGDYHTLTATTPQWLDLEGCYTRFGDVRSLLAKTDDRYVIMNAGDELKLRFTAGAAPAQGWVRDYVLEGDGWVKDGNFCTAYSKTVLPLPTHARADYNTPPGRLEDDPVYRRNPQDWQDYHTRYVSARPYLRALVPQNVGRPTASKPF